jgi:hypothetical protein
MMRHTPDRRGSDVSSPLEAKADTTLTSGASAIA